MGVLTEVILVRKYMFHITYMVAGVFTYCCLFNVEQRLINDIKIANVK